MNGANEDDDAEATGAEEAPPHVADVAGDSGSDKENGDAAPKAAEKVIELELEPEPEPGVSTAIATVGNSDEQAPTSSKRRSKKLAKPPAKILKPLNQALNDFGMIEKGDRVESHLTLKDQGSDCSRVVFTLCQLTPRELLQAPGCFVWTTQTTEYT